MIKVPLLLDSLKKSNVEFFTGVPDSLLKDFSAYITDNTSEKQHIIAANEGGAVSVAVGYHLATGRIPLVYLQNSGLGNTINPLLSLADREIYGIPMILMIGWRGEPNVKDEPQHIKQGRVQNAILDAIEIPYKIMDSSVDDINGFINAMVQMAHSHNGPVAIVVKAGTFETYKLQKEISCNYEMKREDAIKNILSCITDNEIIVSTTGKTSREVFEFRVANGQGNQNDFLTVGSMGHSSQIALGIALNTKRKVICLDGDGSVIMHMGSLSIIGTSHTPNMVHIVINNGAHASVGGQPTVGFEIDLVQIAKACGYHAALSITKEHEIAHAIDKLMKTEGPVFLEIRTRKGARADLGRPTKSPLENKNSLMQTLGSK